MSSDDWQLHQPWTALVQAHPSLEHELEITGCRDCGLSTPGGASFAEHLEQLGAPDYMVEYFRFWAGIVEIPFGVLNRDQVAKELFDYGRLMENATAVYSELADLSKPNTDPTYIIQGAERKYQEIHAYQLAERAWYLAEDGRLDAAEELREVAEEWHEGVVEEVAEDFARRARMIQKEVAEYGPPL